MGRGVDFQNTVPNKPDGIYTQTCNDIEENTRREMRQNNESREDGYFARMQLSWEV